MAQNTSHAVMAQRVEAHDSLDFFPTPPWATRALCRFLNVGDGHGTAGKSCWEPACGLGHMTRPLSEFFDVVYASDVHDYGHGAVRDFLWPGDEPTFDWIVTNPPFRLGMEFALTAIERAGYGVALLVRTSFLEGGERFERLFSRHKPRAILQFCERVPMVKGRLDRGASSATAYCWVVWTTVPPWPSAPAFVWIPPCRKALERPEDYHAPQP